MAALFKVVVCFLGLAALAIYTVTEIQAQSQYPPPVRPPLSTETELRMMAFGPDGVSSRCVGDPKTPRSARWKPSNPAACWMFSKTAI
jgi:hypothetical protein